MSNLLNPYIRAAAAAAGIQFVGGYAQAGATNAVVSNFSLAGALTGGIDSSPQAGDMVIVTVGHSAAADHSSRTISDGAASAYTSITNQYVNGVRDANLTLAYKFMGGSPNLTVSVTNPSPTTSGQGGGVVVLVFRGVNATTPFDTAFTSYTISNSQVTNPAAITPVTSGAYVVVAGMATATAAGGFTLVPTSSDMTIFEGHSTGANSTAAAAAAYAPWTSGAFDPAAWGGLTGNTSSTAVAITMALKPA